MENTEYAMLVGRLEAKIDMLLKFRDEHSASHEKLEARLTKLEGWRWMILGGAAVISAAFEIAKAVLLHG